MQISPISSATGAIASTRNTMADVGLRPALPMATACSDRHQHQADHAPLLPDVDDDQQQHVGQEQAAQERAEPIGGRLQDTRRSGRASRVIAAARRLRQRAEPLGKAERRREPG